MNVSTNRSYIKYPIEKDSSLFDGYITSEIGEDYVVNTGLLKRLARSLGFSYDTYITLSNLNIDTARSLVFQLSSHANVGTIYLLVDEDKKIVLDYSLDQDRSPLLNSEFIKTVERLSTTVDHVKLSEIYYSPESNISSVIVDRVEPITVEEKFVDKDSNLIDYRVGILVVNEETNGAYTRLVVYVNGQPIYLPSNLYNSTTSRFKRSTSSTLEALEVLLLKVFDDLREDELRGRVSDLHYKYRQNKNLLVSYEEYNSLLKNIRKIPTIINEEIPLDDILSKYYMFEEEYGDIEDQKSSYLWRCTAIGDMTLGNLLSITTKLLNDLYAPYPEYYRVREMIGEYISTNRMVSEIAGKKEV